MCYFISGCLKECGMTLFVNMSRHLNGHQDQSSVLSFETCFLLFFFYVIFLCPYNQTHPRRQMSADERCTFLQTRGYMTQLIYIYIYVSISDLLMQGYHYLCYICTLINHNFSYNYVYHSTSIRLSLSLFYM